MRALLLSLLLLPPLLSAAAAQPGPYGGWVTFRLLDGQGRPVTRDRTDITVTPAWPDTLNPRIVPHLQKEIDWEDSTTMRYGSVTSPGGGYVPPGFRFVIAHGGDTMTLFYEGFDFEGHTLGILYFRPGVYTLPYWFDDVQSLALGEGVEVEPVNLAAFETGRELALPRAAPRLRDRAEGERVAATGIERRKRERREDTVWRTPRVGLRITRKLPGWTFRELTFERSVDGGVSWQRLFATPRVADGGIFIWRGEMVAWWNSVNHEPIILRSADDGESWRPVTIHQAVPADSIDPRHPALWMESVWADGDALVVRGYRTITPGDLYNILHGVYDLLVDPSPDDPRYREAMELRLRENAEPWR